VCVATGFTGALLGIDFLDWIAELYSPLGIPAVLVMGVCAARTYGVQTRFGKAVLFAMLGSIAWSLGDLVYDWNVRCDQLAVFACEASSVPAYPSLPDVGYLAGPVLWAVSIVCLWRALGIDTHDLWEMWWVPVCATALVVFVAALTVAEPFAIVYLIADSALLTGAIILWSRSLGFAPFRYAAAAAMVFFVADLTYNARVGAGSYRTPTDISDMLYATAQALLLMALWAFDNAGANEVRARARSLHRARLVLTGRPR
jgi:hypothetical protein